MTTSTPVRQSDTSSQMLSDSATFCLDSLAKSKKSWYELCALDNSVVFVNLMGLVLQCRMESLHQASRGRELRRFYTTVKSYKKLLKQIQRQRMLDTIAPPGLLRRRASPVLGEVEVEENPVVNIPPRIGKGYRLRKIASVKAQFEPTPVEVDYSEE